ncbi:MAG: transcriptional regulator [Propionibacteriaceae bacterium]|jgi:DNA-binding transcriptional regulator LsrR (DeoR family)|nr:transcriptional regulator [Propionibacteriaceae bacterium]
MMHERYDEMYEAAIRYYIHNETMESIARHLKVSRSSVSRLLAEARRSGIVRISLANEVGSRSPAARALAEAFGITVHLVSVGDAAATGTRLERVCRLAASLLSESVHDGALIGAAWGVTMANTVRYLERRALRDSYVVQMNGGNNPQDTAAFYVGSILQPLGEAFDARVVHFPVPAFFDYRATKEAMWRERSVQAVIDYHKRLDLAIFGVGAIHGRVASHVYSSGYLDPEDIAHLTAEGVVGDVNTVLLREDGSWSDIELNARATGLTPDEMRRIPTRIGVVADPSRAAALLGALRAKTMTDLVVDDATTHAVLERMG